MGPCSYSKPFFFHAHHCLYPPMGPRSYSNFFLTLNPYAALRFFTPLFSLGSGCVPYASSHSTEGDID